MLKHKSHAANLTLSIETHCYYARAYLRPRLYKVFFDNDKEAITSRLQKDRNVFDLSA